MTSIDVLENKISAIQHYLAILSRYQDLSHDKIQDDLTLRGAVERYLYLAMQSAIDLAEAIVAFKTLRKPSVYSDNFKILHEAGVISPSLMKKMVGMTGFRNIITHDYAEINFDLVYDVLKKGLDDLMEFIHQVQLNVLDKIK